MIDSTKRVEIIIIAIIVFNCFNCFYTRIKTRFANQHLKFSTKN